MNIHQWKHHINSFNKSFEKNKEVQKEWDENTIENLPRFNKNNSIWNLEGLYAKEKEKAIVLVGSSPCLKDDIGKLKNIDDNFIIICANSSLKFLLRNGIKPHYVICLDSDKIDIPQHLDCDSEGITLLASSVVHSSVLDNWKGPIWYLPYYSINKKLRPKIRKKLGKSIVAGGNSITCALIIATIIFGAVTIIFVANEYCLDKSYYADETAAKQEKIEVLNPEKDVLGRQRWTLPALYVYAIWTEKACADLAQGRFFVDTSFGLLGKDSDCIFNMELNDTINKIKQAFEIKKKLANANEEEKLEIIGRLEPQKDDKSKVYRYNLQTQREKLLQFARS